MEDRKLKSLIKRIETSGYCRIPQVYGPQQVQRALELSKHWYERTKDELADNLPNLARGPFLWNPQNKDIYFLEMMFYSPLVEEILKHFLNDRWFKQIPPDQPNYILRNLLARTTSEDALPMHIDSLVPYGGPHCFVMQVSILLEDMTKENGCTVIVPGSHHSGAYVDQDAFELAVPLEGRAGDVLVWDSRVWHGSGRNEGVGSRWALIATYCRWWLKQMFDITGGLPQEIYEKLTDSQKAVLGFCSLPHLNEMEGVDMKRGYDSLLPHVSDYRQPVAPPRKRSA
jgi:hypothetical protein